MNSQQVQQLHQQGTYEGRPLRGELLETHISWVLLSGTYVFKIKKPVKFTFLNFKNMEQRRHYCLREVELNRRLSNIYLDVQPICRQGTAYHIGTGKGEVVDYAVRMKKCDPVTKMDSLLRGGKVEKKQVLAIAQKLVPFHRKAQIIYDGFDLASFKNDYNDLENISKWAGEKLGAKYQGIIERSVERSNSFLNNHEELLQQRQSGGHYRDVHGDLHSGNIFLYKDPVIFDCIEFNDSFRQIDVLNELAFFCMDLDFHGEPGLSRYFMKEYLQLNPVMKHAGDEQLFRYYKSYRANVRAKVTAYAAQKSEDEKDLKKTVSYLELLQNFWSETEN